MKKLTLTAFTTLIAVCSYAQVNPKAGYVIMNDNDTVYGTIDYRSDMRNAQTCSFKADGATEYTDFRPGDIRGYRLTDNGIYYVTKTFSVGNEEKTIFAEFLIKGGISLYHYKEYTTDYYFMVDSTGRVAPIKETHDLYLATDDRKQAQREKMMSASQMLHQSEKAQKALWTMTDVKPRELARLMRDYNMEYCTDAGDCVTFQYDSEETTKLHVHLRAEAGVVFLRMEMTPHENAQDLELTGVAPVFGVGADIELLRLSRHILFQAMLYYSPNKADGESSAYGLAMTKRKMEFHDLNLQVGALYRFMPEGRITPVVRGGLTLNYLVGYKTENMLGYLGNADKFSESSTASVGFYAGAGAEVGVGIHRLSLSANYLLRNFGHFDFKAPLFMVNVGFVL